MDGDEVVGTDEQVVFAERDIVVFPDGDEDHGEVVIGVLVDLGPLVLVTDVLDGQGMKFERVLEQLVVSVVGRLDVQPEARLMGFAEAPHDVLDPDRGRLAGGRQQGSQSDAQCAGTGPLRRQPCHDRRRGEGALAPADAALRGAYGFLNPLAAVARPSAR